MIELLVFFGMGAGAAKLHSGSTRDSKTGGVMEIKVIMKDGEKSSSIKFAGDPLDIIGGIAKQWQSVCGSILGLIEEPERARDMSKRSPPAPRKRRPRAKNSTSANTSATVLRCKQGSTARH